jgi:hypothetical protein
MSAGDPGGFGTGEESVSRPPHASPGIQIKFTRGGPFPIFNPTFEKDPARSAGGRVHRDSGAVCCGAYVASWHECDIARSRMDVRSGEERSCRASCTPLRHNTIPHCCLGGRPWPLTTTAAGTTAGAQKSRCAQLGCRVSGQAADQNNISRIVSWEIDNGARHGEMVQSD